jgi:RTA1 like protein
MSRATSAYRQSTDSYYPYTPLKSISIVFAVIFSISGSLHTYQNNIKYRSWRIGFLLPWAATLFVAGFILREYNVRGHLDNLDIFIASAVLLFAAPPVYSGAAYFILGRALYYLPYLSPLHPGRVWSTFIGLDVVIEILAGNGAPLVANLSITPERRKIGMDLVKASLILQVILFVGFASVVAVFHMRARRAGVVNHNLKVIIFTMYASSILIVTRNLFRTVAIFLPYGSYTNSTEWLIWVWEMVPMAMNTVMLNIWPPAKYLPSDNKVYLARDGKTELQGPGWEDKRRLLWTVVDPFDVAGLISGKDSNTRFWEKDGIEPVHPKERKEGRVSETVN